MTLLSPLKGTTFAEPSWKRCAYVSTVWLDFQHLIQMLLLSLNQVISPFIAMLILLHKPGALKILHMDLAAHSHDLLLVLLLGLWIFLHPVYAKSETFTCRPWKPVTLYKSLILSSDCIVTLNALPVTVCNMYSHISVPHMAICNRDRTLSCTHKIPVVNVKGSYAPLALLCRTHTYINRMSV